MRCWKCCPASSIHFWHLFRKYAFTQINSISEIQSISRLILSFNCCNAWGLVTCTFFFRCSIDKNRKSPHIRRIESKWNWLYFVNRINPCKCRFPKKMPEMCGWRRTTFPTSHVIRFVIIFFVVLLYCRPSCSGGIAFDLQARAWAISRCHRHPTYYWRHLSKRHCMHVYI